MRDHPFLWVALDDLGRPDFSITPDALRAMWQVPGQWGAKINLDTLIDFGSMGAAQHLPDYRTLHTPRPRFADIKGHNGRRTLSRILEPLADATFTHVNFHVGDSDNLKSVAERARELELTTMGMTQLSHGKVDASRVQELVRRAEEFGFDEVILPAAVASQINTKLKILGTGFRPEGPDEHQPHALHPQQARGLVDSVAIGSPITKANDPVAALKQHLHWLGHF